MWKVEITKSAASALRRLPKNIGYIFRELVDDWRRFGPCPLGWDVKPLAGRPEWRARLNREYRMLFRIYPPNIIVVDVAHRKDAYR